MPTSLALLFKLIYKPKYALASLRDSAPYLAGALLALAATLLYDYAASGALWVMSQPRGGAAAQRLSALFITLLFSKVIASAAPVGFIALVFAPACLLAASLIDRRTSFGVLLRQEYAGLLSCVFYCWAISHLALTIPAAFLSGAMQANLGAAAGLWAARLGYFVTLVALALHVVLRLSYGGAAGGALLACLSLVVLPLVPSLMHFLSSPMILILVILFLRRYASDLLSSHGARTRFKQNMEMATLNQADATAHYNLGLIYQQRGMNEEAKTFFKRAIEIDPEEIDAHYQMGRIARDEGRLPDAIGHFDSVVRLNPAHSQSEVWREIGRAYLQAGQFADAAEALERFLDRRSSDAEGRYHYGLALQGLGREQEAAAEMNGVIESVRTSPPYKYRLEKQWMRDAQSFIAGRTARKRGKGIAE